jgi:short-subunit dehydrogenase
MSSNDARAPVQGRAAAAAQSDASPKIVIITGASSGIGRAAALRLARDGAAVVVSARRADRLASVAREIADGGGESLAVVADVTREADMVDLVGRTIERFGRVDVMVCSAGFGIAGAIDDVSSDQMRSLLDVNFLGTYHAARAVMPVFRRQQRGHLVVISSIVGKRGVPFMGSYAATKFAQVGLAECLRSELAGSPIHVSVVFPISTDTEFFDVMTRASGAIVRRHGPRQRVEAVAESIARVIAHPAPEVYPYWKSRGLVWLNTIAPGVCDRVAKRFGRQRVGAEEP